MKSSHEQHAQTLKTEIDRLFKEAELSSDTMADDAKSLPVKCYALTLVASRLLSLEQQLQESKGCLSVEIIKSNIKNRTTNLRTMVASEEWKTSDTCILPMISGILELDSWARLLKHLGD